MEYYNLIWYGSVRKAEGSAAHQLQELPTRGTPQLDLKELLYIFLFREGVVCIFARQALLNYIFEEGWLFGRPQAKIHHRPKAPAVALQQVLGREGTLVRATTSGKAPPLPQHPLPTRKQANGAQTTVDER